MDHRVKHTDVDMNPATTAHALRLLSSLAEVIDTMDIRTMGQCVVLRGRFGSSGMESSPRSEASEIPIPLAGDLSDVRFVL